jgi:hypothetical protein
LVLAVLRHLARQIGLSGGVETLREMLRRARRVVSHVRVGELTIPQVTLTGSTEDARRLLERIGVPLPEPPETAWIAVCLEAEKDIQVALALP